MALVAGSVVLLPSLAFLFHLFKGGENPKSDKGHRKDLPSIDKLLKK
jgi:hypothetical protein